MTKGFDLDKLLNDWRYVLQQKTLAPQELWCDDSDAGVLVLMTDELRPKLLFTKRSAHLNSHAGEISFVGGKKDATDRNIIDTAMREAKEEIGVCSSALAVIGGLPVQTSKAGLKVRPIVAKLSPHAVMGLVPSEDEIERLLWVDLAYFLANLPTNTAVDVVYKEQALKIQTSAWVYQTDIIWGLTGRIMADLLALFGQDIEWYYRI